MKRIAALLESLSLTAASFAQGNQPSSGPQKPKLMGTVDDVGMVSPALEKYAQGPLSDLWKRPDLSPRDRSIITVAALIA
jgi:4-carboxymuconolactone decarboxylase